MPFPSELPPDDRSQFLRRAALAPLCLCLVAALQVVRVWTCRQTPWKGGGFGMFSTIDDESSRFLRAYLVTNDGDVPLLIPPAADKTVAELRAAPSQGRLDELARRMAEQNWRRRDERLVREVAAIREQDGLGISSAVLHAVNAQPERSPFPGDRVEPIPRDEAPTGSISFTAVRIECLRYRYSAAERSLYTERLLTATARRQEATP